MITRLSVTMLDSYLWGMSNDDMTSEDVAKELFLGKKQNLAMRCGTAFHSVLEHGFDYSKGLEQGFNFLLKDDLDGTIELGTVREKKYVVRVFEDVDLVAKIDAETPNKIIDHKLTGSFDPDRYMDSYQWRAYLVMSLKGKRFKYQVFEHSGLPENHKEGEIIDVKIKAYHELEMYSYQGLINDVLDLVREVADFAKYWKPKLGLIT
ncbi:hypothetical protein [Acinetobacter ursingii]|uniref:hypothetical protein n=1 Tax=Acinetobacter ursingii TaxID=108980 RepID=UPI00029A1BB5|nr:hypothetical protein [Acinetobacter ursingii]ENV76237.1 hypothetical protein F944_01708 [Acinetobacter ursingii DSM 16037 = CIP 107286]QQT67255.1 hypothetical protein I6I52_06395 [Acinetobacter ursingii]